MRPGKTGHDAVIAERQLRVAELRKAGYSYRQIGKAVGVDASTAMRDMHAVMSEVIAQRQEIGEEYRELELERLDALFAGLWPKVREGDAYAIDIARKVSESRRKLLGLDAPTKVAPTTPDGEQAFDYRKLSQADLDALEAILAKGQADDAEGRS